MVIVFKNQFATMDFKQEISEIKERNKKVETDKAWETSITRKVLIALLTYIVMVFLLSAIQNISPYINALVPTLGYLLSTLTVPVVKKYWIKKFLG